MLYENRTNGAVEDICAVIGYTATCTLIEWWGGTLLWVPKTAHENHEIARVLGMPAARALVAAYGDRPIDVPTDYFREQIRQDRIVARMIRSGKGAKEIGAIIGRTARQVQKIRLRLEAAGILSEVPEVGGLLRQGMP